MEGSYISIFQAIWLVFVLLVFCCGEIAHWIHFETEPLIKIKNVFVHNEVKSSSPVRCAALCANTNTCLTSTYDENAGMCRLSGYRVKGPQRNQNRLVPDQQLTTMSRKGCLPGWTGIEEACYYIVWGVVNYTEAKDICVEKLGLLAEPQSNDTFELLRNYLIRTDINEEGNFVWDSNAGVPVYEAWGPGEPDDGAEADCGYLNWHFGYRWADYPCNATWGAICEN